MVLCRGEPQNLTKCPAEFIEFFLLKTVVPNHLLADCLVLESTLAPYSQPTNMGLYLTVPSLSILVTDDFKLNHSLLVTDTGGGDKPDDNNGGRWSCVSAGSSARWELGSRSYTASDSILAWSTATRHPLQVSVRQTDWRPLPDHCELCCFSGVSSSISSSSNSSSSSNPLRRRRRAMSSSSFL